MAFPFLVNNRPALLICATRDMLSKMTDQQKQLKTSKLLEIFNTANPDNVDKKSIQLIVEPSQTWTDLENLIDQYTPSQVILYLESSLDKMPLYKETLIEVVNAKFSSSVTVVDRPPMIQFSK